jgi:hypothetical protein
MVCIRHHFTECGEANGQQLPLCPAEFLAGQHSICLISKNMLYHCLGVPPLHSCWPARQLSWFKLQSGSHLPGTANGHSFCYYDQLLWVRYIGRQSWVMCRPQGCRQVIHSTSCGELINCWFPIVIYWHSWTQLTNHFRWFVKSVKSCDEYDETVDRSHQQVVTWSLLKSSPILSQE